MGLDDALIFTRVVEFHRFAQATHCLGMQKSTVSRRIVLLEERLGMQLDHAAQAVPDRGGAGLLHHT